MSNTSTSDKRRYILKVWVRHRFDDRIVGEINLLLKTRGILCKT